MFAVFLMIICASLGHSSGKFLYSIGPKQTINIRSLTDGPIVQPFSFAKKLKVGQKTSVPCVASGTEPFQFSWTKNGLPVTSTHIELQGSDVSSMLIFKPIKEEDGGEYTCLVKNPVGSASHSAVLFIERKFRVCYTN